jgi:hypothetical protein
VVLRVRVLLDLRRLGLHGRSDLGGVVLRLGSLAWVTDLRRRRRLLASSASSSVQSLSLGGGSSG